MSELEDEIYVDSDSSDNEEQHSKFLSSVSQLDSTQRVKPASRKEIATEISEYNLSKGVSKDLVNVNELANVLKQKAKHIAISNKVKKITQKSKTLPKPLEKPEEDRFKRIIGYDSLKKQVRRWDAIVERNSLKDQQCFPLNNISMSLQNSTDFLNKFQNKTPLEEEIAKVLQEDKPHEKEVNDEMFPLTLEEMIEKRKEMARLRAKLSYKEAKAQRQNKIKSKKYHQILKREKVKQQLKEFEILQKTDPSKALEKLEELDKNRALERASLRHRNTGRWAKNLTVKAKYDVESRKILAEQLKMSREMTKKVKWQESSDEEESTQADKSKGGNAQNLIVSKDNPWTLEVSKEVHDYISNYKKFWDEKNKEKISETQAIENAKENEETIADSTLKNDISNSSLEKNKEISANSEKGNEPAVRDTPESKTTEKHEKIEGKITKTKNKSNDNLDRKNDDGKTHRREGKKAEMKAKSPVEKNGVITVRPTSGVWIVTDVSGTQDPLFKVKNEDMFKGETINGLFNNLEESLIKKAAKKAKKITASLNKYKKRNVKKKLRTGKKVTKKNSLKLSLRGKDKFLRPDLDDGLLENKSETGETGNEMSAGEFRKIEKNEERSAASDGIDPKNFIQIKPKRLLADMEDYESDGCDAIDDEVGNSQRKFIEEAFAEDDVVGEFKKLKKEEGDENQVKISMALPGWGHWGGVGLKPPNRKRKRLTVIKLPPRKDAKKVDIVINENANPNIRNHLVKAIPHPFKSREAFESNIRAPIGREWVPETAHSRLIQKPVETKLGTIIEPMGEKEIIKKNKTYKSPFQGKKRRNKNY